MLGPRTLTEGESNTAVLHLKVTVKAWSLIAPMLLSAQMQSKCWTENIQTLHLLHYLVLTKATGVSLPKYNADYEMYLHKTLHVTPTLHRRFMLAENSLTKTGYSDKNTFRSITTSTFL